MRREISESMLTGSRLLLMGASGATRRVLVPTNFQAPPLCKSFYINRLRLVMAVRFHKS